MFLINKLANPQVNLNLVGNPILELKTKLIYGHQVSGYCRTIKGTDEKQRGALK